MALAEVRSNAGVLGLVLIVSRLMKASCAWHTPKQRGWFRAASSRCKREYVAICPCFLFPRWCWCSVAVLLALAVPHVVGACSMLVAHCDAAPATSLTWLYSLCQRSVYQILSSPSLLDLPPRAHLSPLVERTCRKTRTRWAVDASTTTSCGLFGTAVAVDVLQRCSSGVFIVSFAFPLSGSVCACTPAGASRTTL